MKTRLSRNLVCSLCKQIGLVLNDVKDCLEILAAPVKVVLRGLAVLLAYVRFFDESENDKHVHQVAMSTHQLLTILSLNPLYLLHYHIWNTCLF